MWPFLIILVIMFAAGRVDGECREISTDDTTDGFCVLSNMTIPIGGTGEKLQPDCMAYRCDRENLITMCGLGYKDENQYAPGNLDPSCRATMNDDCTVTVNCPDQFPFVIANKAPNFTISY
ncbi:uncharacterized protein LOC117345041 [Pecten maximus]|uniref:uncharacterized protein LOC117345041 n=1 Tax=Pecten maximus TaxID=6579 RepID=UPI001458AE37|nr:uncharacterized protein LOC117345041 [Pecten maximus]